MDSHDNQQKLRHVDPEASLAEHQLLFQLIVTENTKNFLSYIMQIICSNQSCQRFGAFNQGLWLVRGRIGMMDWRKENSECVRVSDFPTFCMSIP
jgi:hypothetical protein